MKFTIGDRFFKDPANDCSECITVYVEGYYGIWNLEDNKCEFSCKSRKELITELKRNYEIDSGFNGADYWK